MRKRVMMTTENSALNRNKLHFKILKLQKTVVLNYSNNSKYYIFYCIFDHINATVVTLNVLFYL